MSDNDFLSILKKVLDRIADTFSKKGHKHNAKDLDGISKAGLTGDYLDLENRPKIPDVSLATSKKAGIVSPGDGLSVSSGVLSVSTGKGSPIYVDKNNTLNLSCSNGVTVYDGNICSAVVIGATSHKEAEEKLEELIKGDIRNVTVKFKGKSPGTTKTPIGIPNVFITDNIADNYKNIKETVSNHITFETDDEDEETAKEFLRFISADGILDAVGLKIFKETILSKDYSYEYAIQNLGRPVSNIVMVYEQDGRKMIAYGFTEHKVGIVTAYVFNDITYVPLTNIIITE